MERLTDEGRLTELSDSRFTGRTHRPKDAIYALLSAMGYVLLQLLIVRLRVANSVLLYCLSIVSLLATVAYTVAFARSLKPVRIQIYSLLIAAAVILPFMLLPYARFTSVQQLQVAKRVYGVYWATFQAVPGLRGVLVISLAAAVGVVLSRTIREVKLLLPVAIVLALVDIYVVFGGGLVSQANSGKSPVAAAAMQSLTVSLTPHASATLQVPPPLAVGFADYLFIALFFACFSRFHLPASKTFMVLCAILSVYMLVVAIGNLDLPALIPIAAVVIGSNVSVFRYRRDEAFALLYAGLLVIVILLGLAFFTRR